MKKVLAIITIFLACGLFGCASKLQRAPVFDLPTGAQIGVVNFLSEKMKHYHIGTTVFNNFEKDYQVDWKIPAYLNTEFQRQAEKLGYRIVVIEPTADFKEALSDRSVTQGDKVVVNPAKIPFLKELSKKYEIDMLIVFAPVITSVFVPNIEVKAEGYGVVTRGFVGLGVAKAYAAVLGSAMCLKPIAVTRGAGSFRSTHVPGFKTIGDFSNLSEDDLALVRAAIEEKMRKLVADVLLNTNLKRSKELNAGNKES